MGDLGVSFCTFTLYCGAVRCMFPFVSKKTVTFSKIYTVIPVISTLFRNILVCAAAKVGIMKATVRMSVLSIIFFICSPFLWRLCRICCHKA